MLTGNCVLSVAVNPTLWLVPLASVIALVFAWLFYRAMKCEDEGTETMKKIAQHVREGALAYPAGTDRGSI